MIDIDKLELGQDVYQWKESGDMVGLVYMGVVDTINYDVGTVEVSIYEGQLTQVINVFYLYYEDESKAEVGEYVIKRPDKDNVESPSHYNAGSIETIDYLRETMSDEEYRGFCKGNVLKYVSREGYKNGLEDLKKAQKYLEWLIESHEKTPED